MKTITEQDVQNVAELTILHQSFNMYGTLEIPLFLAQDIATMIDYSIDKVGQMLENVDDDEKLTDTIYRSGQEREMWFVTENGLYELLMQSRKPLAKKFKAEIKTLLRQIRMGEYGKNRIATDRTKTLNIENARILFKNFSGAETKYNRKGDRNFCVIIDDERDAKTLMANGWNVKTLTPREEGDEIKYYIQVATRFDNIPPRVYLYAGKTKTVLDEESIGSLDYAEIANVDLTISPSYWDLNGKSGVKAYLKTMHVTIEQDVFASKYNEDFPTE